MSVTPGITYELFYSTGGHGGPYTDLAAARAMAHAMLSSNLVMHAIEIRPRCAEGVGGYGPPVEVLRRESRTVLDSTPLIDMEWGSLRQEGDEDVLFGVCRILGVEHHVQCVRVHSVATDIGDVQEPTNDPFDRYDQMQQLYDGWYAPVDLSRFGFAGEWVVLIHPFCM